MSDTNQSSNTRNISLVLLEGGGQKTSNVKASLTLICGERTVDYTPSHSWPITTKKIVERYSVTPHRTIALKSSQPLPEPARIARFEDEEVAEIVKTREELPCNPPTVFKREFKIIEGEGASLEKSKSKANLVLV